ncbi:MAG: hypothetical protein FIB06_04585 [Betaproteobacteria bacterium]|nr:hypothetical protein [Betaproteobacteria bacterium]
MEEMIVDLLVEHSPPWSAPFYVMLVERWELVRNLAIVSLLVVILTSFWFVVSVYGQLGESDE